MNSLVDVWIERSAERSELVESVDELVDGDDTISAIAYRHGFSDASSVTRAFRRRNAVLPSELRHERRRSPQR